METTTGKAAQVKISGKTRKPRPLLATTKKMQSHPAHLAHQGAQASPPQRRAKRKHVDVMVMLLKKGQINEDHYRAAQEIERIIGALQRCFMPSAMGFDQHLTGQSGGRSRKYGAKTKELTGGAMDPFSKLYPAEEAIYNRRYLPWAKAMAKMPVPRGRKRGTQQEKQSEDNLKVTLFTLTRDMICDNMGPRQWEEYYGYPVGRTASRYLTQALHLYFNLEEVTDPPHKPD